MSSNWFYFSTLSSLIKRLYKTETPVFLHGKSVYEKTSKKMCTFRVKFGGDRTALCEWGEKAADNRGRRTRTRKLMQRYSRDRKWVLSRYLAVQFSATCHISHRDVSIRSILKAFSSREARTQLVWRTAKRQVAFALPISIFPVFHTISTIL